MLSRAVFVKGLCSTASLRLTPVCVQRCKVTNPLALEEIKVLTDVDPADPSSVAKHKKSVELLLKEELPKPYDGPERDHVNFPRQKRAVYPGLVRMGFLPDEWFQFFHKKTGVTGPYVFGAGFLTFMLSKEWYVIEHEFSTGVALFMLIYIAIKKFGPAAKAFSEKLQAEELAKAEGIKEKSIEELENFIANDKKSLWQAEGQKVLMQAKRENVLMQLETEYRKRLMNVYTQVKKRLDFHMDYNSTVRKQQQIHMVDWVVNSVVKSITQQQEKEALQKCLDDLKALSARA